jgi:hypothetical protein
MLGTLFPELELVPGSQSGSMLHSFPVVLLFSLLICKFFDQRIALSFFLGGLSHLMLDSLAPSAISILWPLGLKVRFNLFSAHDPFPNALIVAISLVLLANSRFIYNLLLGVERRKIWIFLALISAFWLATLLAFGRVPEFTCDGVETSLKELQENYIQFAERKVIVGGESVQA